MAVSIAALDSLHIWEAEGIVEIADRGDGVIAEVGRYVEDGVELDESTGTGVTLGGNEEEGLGFASGGWSGGLSQSDCCGNVVEVATFFRRCGRIAHSVVEGKIG